MRETASLLHNARRLVIKIGSSLISGESRDKRPMPLSAIAGDLFSRLPENASIIIVSSGAVALGKERTRSITDGLAGKQALSAIGQIELMERWRSALEVHGKTAAQVLLTPDVTRHRQRYLNARATIRALHDTGAIPIINENDAVATDEIRYGDNDRLAAITSGLIEADCLVLLTDIDGLYTNNPHKDENAEHIECLSWDELKAFDRSHMGSISSSGSGGMASKIEAAIMAGSWGVPTLILDGRSDAPFSDAALLRRKGTHIIPSLKPVPARKKWLGTATKRGDSITIDEGAASALARGASLLTVGVQRVEGQFSAGEAVTVHNEAGGNLGFGLSRLSADDIRNRKADLVIHRNDLALLAKD